MGIMQPGESFYRSGQLQEDLVRRVAEAAAEQTRTVTFRETVTAAEAMRYMAGDIPGTTAEITPGGQAVLHRTADVYFGPKAEIFREEYPRGRSAYGGEELEHYRLTNPALYDLILQQGQESTAHLELLRSAWASYGQYEMPTVPYQEYAEQLGILAAATTGQRGELLRAVSESPEMRALSFRSTAGTVLPSAETMTRFGATDIAGREVSQLVGTWEQAAAAAQFGQFEERRAEMVTQRGFLKTLQELNMPGGMGPGAASSAIQPGWMIMGQEQFYSLAREFYGTNPSPEQLTMLETMVRAREPLVQWTRFPHAEPFQQQDVFLKLGLGWGEGAQAEVGPEALATHPLHSWQQHGDQDADLYRTTLISLVQAAGGVEEVETGQVVQDMLQHMEGLITTLERVSPLEVEQARAEAGQRFTGLQDELQNVSPVQRSLMLASDVLARARAFASESAKHYEKEMPADRPADMPVAQWMFEQVKAKLPSIEGAQEKYDETWLSKGIMGRSYDALIRDIGFRARALMGPELAEQVMSMSYVGYQKALDLGGVYEEKRPLGATGKDPRISYGEALLYELTGSQSLFYGGGYAHTITGEYKQDPTTGGWRAPFEGRKGQPWDLMRRQMGQVAMFGTMATPEQMAIGLLGREDAATTQAIQAAREWIGAQEGKTAQELMQSDEGRRYMTQIMSAAGMSTSEEYLKLEGVLPKAQFAWEAGRTRRQLSQQPWLGAQFGQLEQEYERLSGRTLTEEMRKAIQSQAELEILSGRTRLLQGTPAQQVMQMAGVLPGWMTEGVQQGVQAIPQKEYAVWASRLGSPDWRLFGELFESEYPGVKHTWGGGGKEAHSRLEEMLAGEESLRTPDEGGEGIRTEYLQRGRLADFGVTEYGDIGYSGKIDVVSTLKNENWIIDFKSYSLYATDPDTGERILAFDPAQIEFYGAMAERAEWGGKTTRMFYARENIPEEMLKKLGRQTITEEELADLKRQELIAEIPVPDNIQTRAAELIRTYKERESKILDLVRHHVSPMQRAVLGGPLSGGWGEWQGGAKSGLEFAERNKALGEQYSYSPYGETPLQEVGRHYGIALEEMGVRGIQVLDPKSFLMESGVSPSEVAEMTDQQVQDKLDALGSRAGQARGGMISVRQFTPAETQRWGGEWNLVTQMRGRIAHEAAHVYLEQDPELKGLAEEEFARMLREEPENLFMQDLRQVYPDDWMEKGPSELFAHRFQSRFGSSVGALEQRGLSRFEREVVKAAGRFDIGMRAGEVTADEAAAGGGMGPVFYQQAPGATGAGAFNLNFSQLQQLFGMMRDMRYAEPDERIGLGPEAASAAFRIMAQGRESLQRENILQEPELQQMAGGPTSTSNEYFQFTRLEQLQKIMGGAKPGWRDRRMYLEMRDLARDPEGVESRFGLESGTVGEAMQNWQQILGGDKDFQNTLKAFAKAGTLLDKFNVSLERSDEMMQYLTKHGDELGQVQKAYLEQATKGDLQSAYRAAAIAGGPEFLGLEGAQQAAGMLFGGGGDRGGGGWGYFGGMGGGEGGAEGIIGGAVSGLAQTAGRALGGMGLFTLRRLWSIFGEPAMQGEQVAAQNELAAQGAVAAWTGGGEMGPVAGGLMGMRATQQAAQVRMGEGAYMAYGPVQQMAAGLGGEAFGILGPAVATGAMVGFATQSPIIGALAGTGAAIIGGYNYGRAITQDPVEFAYRMSMPTDMPDIPFTREGRPADMWGLNQAAARYAEETGMDVLGRQIRGGDMGALAGNRPAQVQALQHWAQQQVEAGSFLDPTQLLQMGGEWQAWTGNVQNLYGVPEGVAGAGGAGRAGGGLPTELFESLAARGISIQQVGELAFGIGGTTANMQPLAEALVAQPRSIESQRALQQYGVFGAAGWVEPERLIEDLPELREMTTRQQARVGQMVAGDRYMFSRYGAGKDLGIPSKAMEYIQDQWGGPADWMVTMEPDTGLPLYTTTGEGYSGAYGALETPAARVAGTRGIQWAQFALNRDYQQFQIGQQWNQMQLGYAYQTGQMMPGMGGTVSPEFLQLSAGMGGAWGLQDAGNALAYQQNMYSFQFQQGQLGMQRQQFGEDWQAKFSQFQIQRGWEDEQEQKNRERNAVSDAWWLDQWGYSENVNQMQYGWQMEDLDESIRFATGRKKVQLERQKERTTISESMRREQHEEERDYWEQTRDWRDEDLETQKSHREQINEWREEDMLRQKRHFEDSAEAQEDHINKMMGFYQERKQIEDDRVRLERAFWREQQDANKIALQEWQRVSTLQNQYAADNLRLQQDLQDKSARFSVIIAELGENFDASEAAALRLEETLQKLFNYKAPGGGDGDGTDWGGGIDWDNYDEPDPNDPEGDTGGNKAKTGVFSRAPVDKDRDTWDDLATNPRRRVAEWFWHDWTEEDVIYHSGGPVYAQRMHGGGPAGLLPGETGAVLEEGEYVVPRQGTLVMQENERTVILLEKILFAIEDQGGKITFLVNNPEKAGSTYGKYLDTAYAYRE